LKEVSVNPAQGITYPIYLADSWPDDSQFITSRLKNTGKIFIITQKGLEDLVLRDFLKFMPVDSEDIIYIEQGEKNKHIRQLPEVYNRLIERGADRHSVILALGGGVVGDFAGFTAATLLRGIRFVQLPSTLLSAVDSSVGGKVAVNADLGKNMIGAFHHPEFVYFNSSLLRTLPDREWNCGLAEMVKHSFMDSESLSLIEQHSETLREYNSPGLLSAIEASVKFKSSVVSQDEKETGLRSVLNLGHTAGHAIESFTEYKRFSHGEAISRGLVTALLLSVEKAGLSGKDADKMISLLVKLKLPVDTAGITASDIITHMKYDKKNKDGETRFVLLSAPFTPVYGQPVDDATFIRIWEKQKLMFG
jgi:3-dehydroquinate synthase